MKTNIQDYLNESLENKPEIFCKTIYRLPTHEELEDVNSYDLSSEEIINGFSYTIIGRGMNSEENKRKILQCLILLSEQYPENENYTIALEQYKNNI